MSFCIIGTPVCRAYKDQIPLEFIKYYQEDKKYWESRGVKVLDYTLVEYPDSLCLDADHLNSLGAKKFTQALKKDLMN